jgi:hypothetical protein
MMRLRRILSADFRKSEHTLYMEFAKEEKALAEQLGAHDVIAFVSHGKSIIVFVHGFDRLKDDVGMTKTILHSEKYRLTDGVWDPYMIANYAHAVGIQLTNLRLFEEHFGYLVNGKPIGSRGQLRSVG